MSGDATPVGWLPMAGALLTCLIGLVGMLAPRLLLAATRLEHLEGYALAEGRSTFGFMLLALGAFPLATGDPMAYLTVGIAWLGAAAGRVVSMVVDGHGDSHNVTGVVMQAFIAALLLFPH